MSPNFLPYHSFARLACQFAASCYPKSKEILRFAQDDNEVVVATAKRHRDGFVNIHSTKPLLNDKGITIWLR
jgi:hypothetical protein